MMNRHGSSRLSAIPSSSSRRRVLVLLVIALLGVSPILLGGTIPLSWPLWGIAIGAIALFSGVQWVLSGREPKLVSPALLVAQLAFFALCAYLLLQALPLGDIFGPFSLTLSDGSTIAMRTLSVAPGDTILMLVRMLTFGLLFFLATQAAEGRGARSLLLDGIVLVVTAHALYGLLALFQFGDSLLGMQKLRYIGVATGTFLNRNTFATFLAMGTAVALTCALRSIVTKTKDRVRLTYDVKSVLYLVAVAIMITTIIVTESRAGLAVTFVGIVTVVIATLASNVRTIRPILFAAPVLLILFAVVFLQFGETIWLRYENASEDLDFRLELYRQAAELIAQRPWTGFGGGTFELAFTGVHTATLPNQLTWNEAHNTYLELWADLGLVFGSIPVLLCAGLFVLLLVRLSKGQGSWAAQTAALSALAIAAIHSLVDFSLEIQAVTFLFVVICAIGLAGTAVRHVKE